MYILPREYRFLDKYLIRVGEEVSVDLEVAKRIRESKGKPILFENVILRDGEVSEYPVIANIAGSREYLAEYFGVDVSMLLDFLLEKIDNRKKPLVVDPDSYREVEVDLNRLPILLHYPKDGGYYITSSIIIAYDEEYGLNASFHRMMQISRDKLAVRVVPRHLYEYIERGLKKVAICIGNVPQVLVASAISPELGVCELDIANSIKDIKLVNFDGVIGAEAEIVMVGEITGEEHEEGPFVDLTGTYDIVRKQPVVRIRKIYARENAFYHAILPGDYEHKLLMGLSREPTIMREVRKAGVDCKNVYLTIGGSSWLHCVIQIRKKSEGDGKKAIEAAFKGHKSLKLVIVVEEDIDIYDPHSVEWAIATRVQPDRDLYIYPNQTGSSLDPSANQLTRKTAKWGIDATIPDPHRRDDFMRVV
jgi:UbiD family decarboxylase